MLPYKMYYQNSRGEIVRFDEEPIICTKSTLFDYNYQYNLIDRPRQNGGRLLSTRMPVTTKDLTVSIGAWTQQEYNDAMNRLYSVIDFDNAINQSGRLYVNDSYISCRIVGSKKDLNINLTNGSTQQLQVAIEQPMWIREQRYIFSQDEIEDPDGHKYPYDYPFRYGTGGTSFVLRNSSVFPAPMRIRFWGVSDNPSVIIGDQSYGANVSLTDETDVLVIDQFTKEVYVIESTGDRNNAFNDRTKETSVFDPVRPGGSTLSIVSQAPIEIIVYEQRGEPEWI